MSVFFSSCDNVYFLVERAEGEQDLSPNMKLTHRTLPTDQETNKADILASMALPILDGSLS